MFVRIIFLCFFVSVFLPFTHGKRGKCSYELTNNTNKDMFMQVMRKKGKNFSINESKYSSVLLQSWPGQTTHSDSLGVGKKWHVDCGETLYINVPFQCGAFLRGRYLTWTTFDDGHWCHMGIYPGDREWDAWTCDCTDKDRNGHGKNHYKMLCGVPIPNGKKGDVDDGKCEPSAEWVE